MGKILESAKDFRGTETFTWVQQELFEGFAKVIESEIEQIGQKIDRNVLDAYKMLAQRTKRIEALEKSQKQIEALIDLRSFRKWLDSLKIKKPVPTDKNGKPEGGLEPGDVISHIVDDHSNYHGKRALGQFWKAEADVLWGYWQNLALGEIENNRQWVEKSRVTFEFRPRFLDRKER